MAKKYMKTVAIIIGIIIALMSAYFQAIGINEFLLYYSTCDSNTCSFMAGIGFALHMLVLSAIAVFIAYAYKLYEKENKEES